MKLSIIVPVYNVKDYLLKCLDSISNQTLDEYEVIVVDDGSTDGSGQLVDDYCNGKERFKVYHKENGGLMSAWKYGLERAVGEYVGFVDSDDYIASNMYDAMMQRVLTNHSDIVLCNHYYVDEDGEKTVLHRNPIADGYYEGEGLEKIRHKMLPKLGEDYISPSRVTKIIKRDLVHNCLKYTDNRVSSGEDVNSMVPCMLSCKSFEYIAQPFYYYVQRSTSISYVFKSELFDTYTILVDCLKRVVHDLGMPLQDQVESLHNVYGVTWCEYVRNSSLRYYEKKKQIKRLFEGYHYVNAATRIRHKDGTAALLYRAMMTTKSAGIYLGGRSLHLILYRLIKGD